MTSNKAVFTCADQTLTLVATEGKKGFNVKASMKTGKGKGQPKAITGCRETFKTLAEATAALTKLGEEALKRGWTAVTITKRNSFDAIPVPTAKMKAVKALKSA